MQVKATYSMRRKIDVTAVDASMDPRGGSIEEGRWRGLR